VVAPDTVHDVYLSTSGVGVKGISQAD
jgi:hypothetical protein